MKSCDIFDDILMVHIMDNNKVRYLLRNVFHEHGIDIIHKPLRLNSILRDYAKGQFDVEIYLLLLSATEGIVDELLKNKLSPLNVLAAKLSLQLHEKFGIDKSSATWAVDSWIFALNLNVDIPSPNLTARVTPNKIDTHFSERNREAEYFFTVEQTTKKLAVLFADICGSTSLFDALGDDLARHFTANCIKTMISEISHYKGTLIKTIGDEIMCTFPNAQFALSAACAMQNAVKNSKVNSKQPLSIRVGFHYGIVICEANDVFGDTVNVAARVAGLAKADQIMTTAAVYVELPAILQNKTRQFKSATLKGKQEQCEIYWVLWKEDEDNENPPLPSILHYDTRFATTVILKYIPRNTTYRQILQFVKPALEGGMFSKSGMIERILVLVRKDRLSDIMEFHAILYIQPAETAKKAIDKLHRKQLNNHYIAVAEYIERSIHNSRNNIHTKAEHPEGKRVTDRRDTNKLFRLIAIEQLKDFTWTENSEV
jgi:class 3 adenylate cyclase